MCGIAGFLNFKPSYSSGQISDLVRRMTRLAIHRGPDDEGYWNDDSGYCFFGHRRLSVIDLSPRARQPIADYSERYLGVVNGEIYNYRLLGERLRDKGIFCRSDSDSEVFINLYAQLGKAALQIVDGMFAFAIYDTETRQLILGRDAAGEKPLYYVHSDNFFAFGSELTQLLVLNELGFDVEFDEQSLCLYMLLRYVPPPRSILQGIHKLEPGCTITVTTDQEVKKESWFRYDLETPAQGKRSLDDLADEVEDLLTTSIRNRLVSDVPVGLLLSSGVDSSLVTAISTKKLNKTVKTFSCGFKGDQNSEHLMSREVARHFGTNHNERILSSLDFDELIDDIGSILDEPNGDRSCIPTYLISEFARDYVKVVLSGDGADELFGGYGRYLAFGDQRFDPAMVDPRKVMTAYFDQYLPVFPPSESSNVVPSSAAATSQFFDQFQTFFMQPNRSFTDSLRLLDFHTYMPGAVLSKVDRMSMRHGLEVRAPFLFRPLMSWSSHAPSEALVHDNVQKRVLRHLLERYLPQKFTKLPKRGFGMPPSVFQNNKERIERELANCKEILSATRFFGARPDALRSFVEDSLINYNSIWAAITLSKWIEAKNLKV